MGKQEGLPGIAQIILANLMQKRNLKNTKTVQAIEESVKGKDRLVGALETRQIKIQKVIGTAIEAIKGGDKVK
jgi:hypothetical protein